MPEQEQPVTDADRPARAPALSYFFPAHDEAENIEALVEEALSAVSSDQELMVIGGAQLFDELLPIVDRLYLTEIDGQYEGDVYFPQLDRSQWREVAREEHPQDGRHDSPFTFLVLERIG